MEDKNVDVVLDQSEEVEEVENTEEVKKNWRQSARKDFYSKKKLMKL